MLLHARQTWEALSRTPARMNGGIAAIHGVGKDIWVGGSGGLTTLLWHSSDGGQTFEDQDVPDAVRSISAIYAASATNVWAVGKAEDDCGLILSTEDGGHHWSADKVPETTTSLAAVTGFTAASNGSELELWAVGSSGSVFASILSVNRSHQQR
jgi:photosystem II stability/assembly factor-like uncharacterized protein